MAFLKIWSAEVCFSFWNQRALSNYLSENALQPILLQTERSRPGQFIDQTLIQSPIGDLFPVRLKQIRRTPFEKMFNSLVNQYHYLGYTQPVGEHLKYMAFSHDRPIACLAWGSAPWYIGTRDRFIGWTREIREKNLHLIANNLRFLILPWVQVSCLASYLLALNRHRLSQDWQRLYRHPIYLVETFVNIQRYSGTCYNLN